MRTIVIFIANLICASLFAQKNIPFKEPLKVIAKERVNSAIQMNDSLFLRNINIEVIDGYEEIKINAIKSNGSEIKIDPKKLYLFEFKNINNSDKVWLKRLLLNETYYNMLLKGYQYDLRNELNTESIEYVNTLNKNQRFFDDDYLEDYLFILANKIYSGFLKDNRSINLNIKIIKDNDPNAFTLPNGCILVSTGLLSTIQTEDELVGILAHEIAHFISDHHLINYNKQIDRKNRAVFWSSVATVVAAGIDVGLSVNNRNYFPGMLTASTAILASAISDEVIERLGIKYSQAQEMEADIAAKEILNTLGYNTSSLSIALMRIKNYSIKTGNYVALTSTGTHPSVDSRIELLGGIKVGIDSFTQNHFFKKVSLVNSYNAWIQLFSFANYTTAFELAERNIINGIGTESDYIVKAIVLRRISNNKESNEKVIELLKIAKGLNITPYILIHKEEGISFLRLQNKLEAKKSFQNYVTSLTEIRDRNEIKEFQNFNQELEDEITWTKKMIFRIDNF